MVVIKKILKIAFVKRNNTIKNFIEIKIII